MASAGEGGVVVVGGGVVGVTAAYYLGKKGVRVTIVEKCAIACHSSGKAGGFLTDGDSGWHGSPSMVALAKHSFGLHRAFAEEFGADRIGYRAVKCVGGGGSGRAEDSLDWLRPDLKAVMGRTGMAQVSPRKLMDALAEAVAKQGCEVVIAKVVGVQVSGGVATGVRLLRDGTEQLMPCSGLILAMGPWARDATAWFPESNLPTRTVSDRYTSVIWDDVEVGKDATMVFVSGQHDVEIYPRADECYANGCPTDTDLPDDPLDIVPPEETVENVKQETVEAVERLRNAKVLRTTACFLPGSDTNTPVISRVKEAGNAVIACGGGCWGMTNGPAMGQAAAALVSGEAPPPIDLEAFDLTGSRLAQAVMGSDLQGLLAARPELARLLAAAQGGGDDD